MSYVLKTQFSCYLFPAVILGLIRVINPKNQISFDHWNLNGLAVHNFSLLQTLSITHDHDIICLLEIFLNWSAFKKR